MSGMAAYVFVAVWIVASVVFAFVCAFIAFGWPPKWQHGRINHLGRRLFR